MPQNAGIKIQVQALNCRFINVILGIFYAKSLLNGLQRLQRDKSIILLNHAGDVGLLNHHAHYLRRLTLFEWRKNHVVNLSQFGKTLFSRVFTLCRRLFGEKDLCAKELGCFHVKPLYKKRDVIRRPVTLLVSKAYASW